MKTALRLIRLVCLTGTIIAQILWIPFGIIFGIIANFESIGIGCGPSWDVFQDELIAPTNWYLWTFKGWTIA